MFQKILLLLITFIVFTQNADAEFYEEFSPIRSSLADQYAQAQMANNHIEIDINKINSNYINRQEQINKDTIKLEEKQEAKKIEEKQKAESEKKLADIKKKAEEKKGKKGASWIDKWLLNTKTKPFELVGMYSSAKIMMAYQMDTKFSSYETRSVNGNSHDYDLFSGKASYWIMPYVALSAGNDKRKWFRWEFELGYRPVIVQKIKSLKSYPMDTNITDFTVGKKDLSFHLLTCIFQAFYQHEFFDKNLIGFIGAGAGFGYAWGMGSKVSGNFVLPIVRLSLGVNMMITKKIKLNIAFFFDYMQLNMWVKYAFTDNNNIVAAGRAIQNGRVKFGDMFVSGLSFEYQFYVV